MAASSAREKTQIWKAIEQLLLAMNNVQEKLGIIKKKEVKKK